MRRSCTAAATSDHLTVIATARAGAAGVISVDPTLPAVDAGPGRIGIVYATAVANLIVGCAQP